MRSVRVLSMTAIAGLLAAGVLMDLPDRAVPERPVHYVSSLAAPAGAVSTWFCPGGSGSDGEVELTIQMASGSAQPRTAAVSVLPGGSDVTEARTVDVEIEAYGRELLRPSEAVPGARWVGAVVEGRRHRRSGRADPHRPAGRRGAFALPHPDGH